MNLSLGRPKTRCNAARFWQVCTSLALQAVAQAGFSRMREIVKLESTAGTGYFYTTTRNKKAQGGKLEVMKYDPKIRKHVKFVEKKASK